MFPGVVVTTPGKPARLWGTPMKRTTFMLGSGDTPGPSRCTGLLRGSVASQDARSILSRLDQRTQQRNAMRRANQSGFTLIELLIAISLVGILSAVAIVGLSGVTKSGNNSACKSTLASAQTAAATYYANTGNYPATTGSTNGFDLLAKGTPILLTLPAGVTESGNVMNQGTSWSVTMQGGGANVPNTYIKTGGGTACA